MGFMWDARRNWNCLCLLTVTNVVAVHQELPRWWSTSAKTLNVYEDGQSPWRHLLSYCQRRYEFPICFATVRCHAWMCRLYWRWAMTAARVQQHTLFQSQTHSRWLISLRHIPEFLFKMKLNLNISLLLLYIDSHTIPPLTPTCSTKCVFIRVQYWW